MNHVKKKSASAKERRYKSFELKKTGKSYRDIALELGCSHTLVVKDVIRVLREMRPPQEDVDHHRAMLVTRYEMILERLYKELEGAGILVVPAIIERILRTLNQIADITGVKEKRLVVTEAPDTDLRSYAELLRQADGQ